MKRKKVILMAFSLLVALSIATIAFGGPTGSIRINPSLPTTSETTETFTITLIPSATPTWHPYILLAMTSECYDSGAAVVTVSWSGGGSTFNTWLQGTEPSVKVPPEASIGAGYTIASLKDHLDTELPIYWYYGAILNGPIYGGETIDVTLTTTGEPRMLVYILGSSSELNPITLDRRVPPTQPGFMIPELPLGTMMAVASMMAALILVARKRSITFR